ncbi:MAG: hypothetical protein RMM31_03165 [Anaerolineae bacterium]|nr:hypothetical protein [Thermoflexales bacterium]MDW8395223.1 hypothetical protein [Anaerolineae bacterium]
MQRLLISLALVVLTLGQVQPLSLQAQSISSPSNAVSAPEVKPTPTVQARRMRRPATQPICALADRARTELVFARINAWREARGVPPAAWDEEAHQHALRTLQRVLQARSLENTVLLWDIEDIPYSRQMVPADLSAPDLSPESLYLPCSDLVQGAERVAVAGIVCRRMAVFKFKPNLDMHTTSVWLVYSQAPIIVRGC